jgi:glycosyltransferase involved in cell wall biosynthesis
MSISIPKISIVTISYNQAHYLEETILSVINQKYSNLEYIIIDGGSTDDSVDVINKYSDFLTYWISEKDTGPADALNKGLEKCTGDYFFYLNSDDYLEDHILNDLITMFSQHKNVDVFYGHGRTYVEKSNSFYPTFSDKWNLWTYYNRKCTIFQQATFIKMDMLKTIGGFNILNKQNWDGQLLVDLALNDAKFFRFSKSVAVFRLHGTSFSGGGSTSLYLIEVERIEKKILTIKNNYFKAPVLAIMYNAITDPLIFFKRVIAKLTHNYD